MKKVGVGVYLINNNFKNMPPQDKSPILSTQELTSEKQKQKELVAEMRLKQKTQQDRWEKEKKDKEEGRNARIEQIRKEAEEARQLRNLSMPHIKPFDPEKHGKDGKSIAGNQGEED